MRWIGNRFVRIVSATAVIIAMSPFGSFTASAASLDQAADAVIGQPNLNVNLVNQGGAASAQTLNTPRALAVDPTSGRLWVADQSNNRVLGYPNAVTFTNNAAADIVIGQPNFTATAANQGLAAPTANTLSSPRGVAVGPSGNLFVTDNGNNRVLMYSAPITIGMAATIVIGQANFITGQPNRGLVAPTAQTMSAPRDLEVDTQGNLWLADTGNHRVVGYKAPLATDMNGTYFIGQSSPFIGLPNNGAVTSARTLNTPQGLYIDSANNDLWVADAGNNRVLRYEGAHETFEAAVQVFGQPDFTSNTVDNGGLSASSLDGPFDVELDSNRNVYIADNDNNRVVRHNPNPADNAAALQVFGQPNFTSSGVNNPSIATGMNQPFNLAFNAERDLLVADFDNNRVLRFDTPVAAPTPVLNNLMPNEVHAGVVGANVLLVGTGFIEESVARVNGTDRPIHFISPTRIETTLTTLDTLYPGAALSIAVSNPSTAGGELVSASRPITVYLRTSNDTTIDGVLGQPNFTTGTSNTFGRSNRSLDEPRGFAIDPATSRIFVADSDNSRVMSWPSAAGFYNSEPADLVFGQHDFISGQSNQGAAGPSADTLAFPYGVAIDPAGNLWVADRSNHRVLRYTAPFSIGQNADLVLGQPIFSSNAPNQGGGPAANTLNFPESLIFGPGGALFVADTGNHRVLRYVPAFATNMNATAAIGQPNLISGTANNGGVSATSLNGPSDVHAEAGVLVIADRQNNRVLVYTGAPANGLAANIVLGQPNFTSNGTNAGGTTSASSFDLPSGVTMDRNRNIWVGDHDNDRVLRFAFPVANNPAADFVLGQVDFTGNIGATSRTRLDDPRNVRFDVGGNLYVSESASQRLARYDQPGSYNAAVPVSTLQIAYP